MTTCLNCVTTLIDYAETCNNCGRSDCIADDFENEFNENGII